MVQKGNVLLIDGQTLDVVNSATVKSIDSVVYGISKIQCAEACLRNREEGKCNLVGYHKVSRTCFQSLDDRADGTIEADLDYVVIDLGAELSCVSSVILCLQGYAVSQMLPCVTLLAYKRSPETFNGNHIVCRSVTTTQICQTLRYTRGFEFIEIRSRIHRYGIQCPKWYRGFYVDTETFSPGRMGLLELLRRRDKGHTMLSQWAQSVVYFSSQKTSQNANQILGPADVYPNYGGAGVWCPANQDQSEFIEIQFAEPVHVTSIDIYETWGSGSVQAIKCYLPEGVYVNMWTSSTTLLIQESRIFSPTL
ncbi:hypothetical protein MAR_034751, partial [Mya arenaria]